MKVLFLAQAAEKDVKLAGKLLGQLVLALDSEERADVMDTLEHKVQSHPDPDLANTVCPCKNVDV
jgi:hypothetical protein